MIRITYDNTYARFDSAIDPGVITYLREELRYRSAGYEHVYSFKSGRWDGYTSVFDAKTNSFRRGLLDRVVALIEQTGQDVVTEYTPPSTPPIISHKLNEGLIQPYKFQQDVLPAVHNNPIGIITSPTGSGKTCMIALMLNEVRLRTLILVTDIVLLDQMQLEQQKYFDQPIGMIGDQEFDLQDITVSTIQSLLSITRGKSIGAATKRKILLEHLKTVGMVISDEAHLYDSNGVAEVLPFFKDTQRFYGMSATPYGWAEKAEKVKNLELEQHFGRIIYDSRKLNFVELGLKVPILVNITNRVPINKEYKQHTKKTRYKVEIDWTKNYRECLETEILNNEKYHEDVASYAWTLAAEGKSSFVHAAHSIAFGEKIKSMIPGSVLINGKTPRLERRKLYKAMRDGELLTIVSDVGGTGLDIPNLNAMVLASDVKDVRQLLGRVARKPRSGNKEYGIVADFHTDTQFLHKHHQIRKYQYEHEKYVMIG